MIEYSATYIMFLGGNTNGILRDAEVFFGKIESIILIVRDNDMLMPPNGLVGTPVSAFHADKSIFYVIIGNGGTTAQQIPVLAALVAEGCSFEVYDINKGNYALLWHYSGKTVQ